MPWVRLDEKFARHPKVVEAGPLAIAMQVAALCYCNDNLTDGRVPRPVAATLLDLTGLGMRMWSGELMGGGEDAAWEMVVEDLVGVGMWHEPDHDCEACPPISSGFVIHDYTEFQPSKEDVERMRRQKAEAGRKGGKAPRKAGANQSAKQVLEQVPSKDSSKTEAESKPDPVPDPDIQPLPTVEVTDESPILDESRSDPDTGLEVWVDSDGKQRQRVDGLWDEACELWGTPKTDKERGRRNKEIKELRLARVHPEMLKPLFLKAQERWDKRPQLNGIITNLGDLLEGMEISPTDIKRYQAEVRKLHRRNEIMEGPDGP